MEPDDEIEAAVEWDRQRILKLIKAHRDIPESLQIRLENLIMNGVDLDEEMKRPIADRVIGFHWPDA